MHHGLVVGDFQVGPYAARQDPLILIDNSFINVDLIKA